MGIIKKLGPLVICLLEYCVIRRPNQNNQYVRQGTTKRLYREDKPICSEVCRCSIGGANCTSLGCLESHSCESRRNAIFRHMQPSYIAFQGHCICYSGDFICEKPKPDSYTLPSGVFLFLGFSKKDEDGLTLHTMLTVQDVASALQDLISPHDHYIPTAVDDKDLSELQSLNATACRLGLFKKEGENLIINATMEEDLNFTRQPNKIHYKREKDQCLQALVALNNLVNKQHPVIYNHVLLSILKVANVQENIPNENSSANQSRPAFFLQLLRFLSYFLF